MVRYRYKIVRSEVGGALSHQYKIVNHSEVGGALEWLHIYRPCTEYDGRLCFHRCLLTGGRGYPKVPSPPTGQGTYPHLTKVPTPLTRSDRGVTPRYLPPGQGTYPLPGPMGEEGRGSPRYLSPRPPRPRYLPPGTEQHMEYLIRCGRYASCVHVGGPYCDISYCTSSRLST